jgi:hypothetical protein
VTVKHAGQPGPLAAAAVLALAVLSAAGCKGPGFLAYVIAGPKKIPARYTLEPRPTLVIVDDPSRALGDPNYATVVGANVGFHLKQNQALPETMIVSQDKLSALASELGEDYASTPVDRIGARLGADQVVYVLVRSVTMQVAPGYFKPLAVVEVKVIDTPTGRRLFPDPGVYQDPRQMPPGHTLSIEMTRQTLDPGHRQAAATLARSLSEKIGLEVAQLFYRHAPIDTSPGR